LTNCDLSDEQWRQASLPINTGGLGVRKVSSLALSAYLASSESTASLQNTIFDSVRSPEDEMLGVYLSRWSSLLGAFLPSDPLPTKWSFWESPGITQARQQVGESKSDATQKAQFLAASAPHSGDWLLALPVASCGRFAVALRLGLNLGAPHTCRCGATVDALGQHSLVCKQAPSRIARHQHLNDLVTRALVSAGITATKEPVGLIRRDGKRPDGMKLLVWDVTVVSTTAESYVAAAARERGEVAEMAATRKCQKYSELSTAYLFLPILDP